jgi:hypothetical protein
MDAAAMKKPLPSQSNLQERFEYSVITGALHWRTSPHHTVKVGTIAGNLGTTRRHGRYRRIKIANENYPAHRIIWCLVTGEDPGVMQVDHINGDSSDNSWHNLRLVTPSENGHNQRLASDNKSGYTGVCWNRQHEKWGAFIGVNGKQRFLGRFATPEEAHQAYLKAKRELHPSAPARHFAGVQ